MTSSVLICPAGESTARPLEEANTQDIKTALCKLDKARQLPNIMVDAFSLDKIPRWHPEEQNQICLADRMLRLENRVTRLQETMDNNMAENMVLKEKMDCMKERDNTYADMVKGQSPTHRSPVLTKQIHKDNNQSDANVQQDQPLQEQNEKNDDDAPIKNTTDIGTERNVDDKPTAMWRGHGNQRGRGFVRGHGRGGRGRDHSGERGRGVSNRGYNRGYNHGGGRENNNEHGNYSHLDLQRFLERAISSLTMASVRTHDSTSVSGPH